MLDWKRMDIFTMPWRRLLNEEVWINNQKIIIIIVSLQI